MSIFPQLVQREIERARAKHGPSRSLHEGYAILLEEVDEFWDAVKNYPKQYTKEQILSELVQVAAMAQRVAEDCALITGEQA